MTNKVMKGPAKTTWLIAATLLLGVASLFLEQSDYTSTAVFIVITIIDIFIVVLLVVEIIVEYRAAPYKKIYLKNNIFSLCFAAVYLGLFFYTKSTMLLVGADAGAHTAVLEGGKVRQSITTAGYAPVVIIVRNIFLVLKVFSRFRRLAGFIENIIIHPAQTIFFSFLIVIIIGTFLLMLPISTADNAGLPFLDSLFTATSAVCVTGLIVVDTATYFSVWGKIIILALIQIGGLGIMILSYFTMFALHRAVSIEDKLLISYMLSEDDMRNLTTMLRSIIYITFAVEAIGALLLFIGFSNAGIADGTAGSGLFGGVAPAHAGSIDTTFTSVLNYIFYSIFHAISAFCNAGFALFTDSLEQYRGNIFINGVVCFLIITGGLSFIVIANIKDSLTDRIKKTVTSKNFRTRHLTLNTKIILIGTAVLIFSGLFLLYALEHGRLFASYPLGRQYLASFFQSVTLRTAGFNTVPIGSLSSAVLFLFVLYMFVGAASGSTAGGIKINTITVIGAYIAASFKQRNTVTIANHSIDPAQVLRSFLILAFGLTAVVSGTTVLLISEGAPLTETLFEAVSAFATVGLSTGITSSLSAVGKIVIILLMFFGRLGPLTVLAAVSPKEKQLRISYPKAEISIG